MSEGELQAAFAQSRVTPPPDREALVVGRLLADMSEGELQAAFAQSRVPADPDRRPGFFAEISERRRS